MKRLHPSLLLGLVSLILSISNVGATVMLVQTSDPGFYNNAIGNSLNLSGLTGVTGTGSDTCAEPFPNSNDCHAIYSTAPNLNAANAALGNWLGDPLHLNSNWNFLSSIPNSWPVGTEVAVMYQFNTLGATGVKALFGVDNGIYAFLDGTYLLGRRDAGGVALGEYSLDIGNLSAGTHFLQLLLEDHGSTNGYAVKISADTFIPGPPPGGTVPEPSMLSLVGLAVAGLLVVPIVRRKFAAAA